MEEMQFQGQTGKIYNAGTDRWGRPVVIFNNSVNNSNDPAQQMRYLAFNLEMALRKARVRALRRGDVGENRRRRRRRRRGALYVACVSGCSFSHTNLLTQSPQPPCAIPTSPFFFWCGNRRASGT